MIETILSHPLGVAMVSLPIAILTMNLLGAAHGVQTQRFDWAILYRGLYKGIVIYIAVGLLCVIFLLNRDISIEIGGSNLDIVQGLTYLIRGSVVYYIYDIFTILTKVFMRNTKEEE